MHHLRYTKVSRGNTHVLLAEGRKLNPRTCYRCIPLLLCTCSFIAAEPSHILLYVIWCGPCATMLFSHILRVMLTVIGRFQYRRRAVAHNVPLEHWIDLHTAITTYVKVASCL